MLTANGTYELRVDLTDRSNRMTYALYKKFIVGDENSQYKLTINEYSGTAGMLTRFNEIANCTN